MALWGSRPYLEMTSWWLSPDSIELALDLGARWAKSPQSQVSQWVENPHLTDSPSCKKVKMVKKAFRLPYI